MGEGSSPDLPQWLIASKMRPPVIGASVSRRSDLRDYLMSERRSRVTLLTGPAGYGKTTLCSQWYSDARDQGCTVFWLSLDEGDADPGNFATYLLAGFRREVLEGAGLWPLSSLAGTSLNHLKVLFSSALEQLTTPAFLFLDDYHRCESAPVNEFLEFLVNAAPPEMHFIIASRQQPSLPLGSYLAQGRLTEMTLADLAFTADETDLVLGGDIDRSALEYIESRFEGWPAGLRLLKLWVARGQGGQSRLHMVSGRSEDLARYLAEQVFQSLPPAIQQFLLATSVLERFNSELAMLVSGLEEAAALLEEIGRQNLFLVPLDYEGEWFRYHVLFGEFLSAQLRRLHPERPAAIHRMAAQWFATKGLYRDAITEARRVEDPEFLAGLVEAGGGWRLMLRIGSSILQVTENLPTEVILKHPSLGLSYIYTTAQSGRVGEAQYWHRKLHEATRGFTVCNGEPLSTDLWADGKMLELVLRVYQDDIPTTEELQEVTGFLGKSADRNPLIEALSLSISCYIAFFANSFEESMEIGRKARQAARALGTHYAANYINYFLFMNLKALGRPGEIAECLQDTLEQIRLHFGSEHSQVRLVSIFLADVACDSGDLEHAATLVEEGLPVVVESEDWTEAVLMGFTVLSRVLMARGQVEVALETLDAPMRRARRDSLWRLEQGLLAEKIILACRAGERERALMLAQSLDRERAARALESGDAAPWRSTLPIVSAWILVLLLEGAAERAAATAASLRRIAESTGNDRMLLGAKLMQLLTADSDTAKPLLAETLTLAVALDCRQAVRDFAGVLAALHGRHAFSSAGERYEDDAGRLWQEILENPAALTLEGLAPAISSARDSMAGHATIAGMASLSARESEILALIAAGLSGKEIARELAIAEGTVKTYRKRIYSKLDVNYRSQAIATAREQGLIN